MARRGHGYLDWAGLQLIMGGTLPSPVRRFSVPLGQFVSETFPRRTGQSRPQSPRCFVQRKGQRSLSLTKRIAASGNEIVTSADLIDACAYKMPSCSTAREENMLRGHQTVER